MPLEILCNRDLMSQEIGVLEKLAASQHNFDNIVRYYQAWQENGKLDLDAMSVKALRWPCADQLILVAGFFFLQMELCEGGTLQDFMATRNRDENLPENYVWNILRDIASGLKVLHDHDIVHLDVKPDNIFITEDGRLKIGDFGMAGKVVTSSKPSSQFGDLEGDAKYMAKELLSSADRLPSADIFCLGKIKCRKCCATTSTHLIVGVGIMMLEIVTGMTLPEAGKDWHELREGVLPSFSPEYSEDLSALIRQVNQHPRC